MSPGWCVLMFPFKLACPFIARSWELSIKYGPIDLSLYFFIPRRLLSKYVLAVMKEVWLVVGFKIVSVAVESVAAVVGDC